MVTLRFRFCIFSPKTERKSPRGAAIASPRCHQPTPATASLCSESSVLLPPRPSLPHRKEKKKTPPSSSSDALLYSAQDALRQKQPGLWVFWVVVFFSRLCFVLFFLSSDSHSPRAGNSPFHPFQLDSFRSCPRIVHASFPSHTRGCEQLHIR